MSERTEIQRIIGENKQVITAQIDSFWRRTAEDLMQAGISKKTVVESMMAVAHGQGMKLFGSTDMARRMLGCAEVFQVAAANGVERPAVEH
jgi:hypothetical protein